MVGPDMMQLSDRLKRTTFIIANIAQNATISIASAKVNKTRDHASGVLVFGLKRISLDYLG